MKIKDQQLNDFVKEEYCKYNQYWLELINTGMIKRKKGKPKITKKEEYTYAKTEDILVTKKEEEIIKVEYLGLFKEFNKVKDSETIKELIQIVSNVKSKLPKKEYGILIYDSDSLFKGRFAFLITDKKYHKDYYYNVISTKNDFKSDKEWLTDIQNQLNQIIADIFKTHEELVNFITYNVEMFKQSFIAKDIINLCLKNQSNNLTEKKIIDYLSGRKVENINPLPHLTPYKNCSYMDFRGILNCLINTDLLKTERIDTKYGNKFYKYKINNQSLCSKALLNGNIIQNQLQYKISDHYEIFTDLEALHILNTIQLEKIKDYLLLLRLMNSKGFIIKYQEEFLNKFKNIPEEVSKLIKIQKDNETDKFKKKLLKEILTRTK